MATRNRIPPAIEAYLRLPPEQSLILLTGTLGCSVNWLTVRFVGALLDQHRAKEAGLGLADGGREDERETAVVLVSCMRDLAFWKTELRRTMGVDAAKMTQHGKLWFVDCFTTLASQKPEGVLAAIEQNITAAVREAVGGDRKVVLVVDNIDVLLTLALSTAQQLSTLLLKLRSQVHAAILTCAADLPLVSAATSEHAQQPATPIEVENAAFIVQQVFGARMVMSVRDLDTGSAKDVSGVLRVTRGGAAYDGDEAEQGETWVREMEALYLVQSDGSARVFERGSDGM